jgi:hypothetical protein
MFSLKHLIVIAAVFVAALAIFAGTASADPGNGNGNGALLVVNHGNNPGDSCTQYLLVVDPYGQIISVSEYDGFMQAVVTSDSFKLSCHTRLVLGPGVSSTTRFPGEICSALFTASGEGLLQCRY